MPLRLLLVALCALLASACQLSLATDIAVDADGAGELQLAVAVDEELRTLLDDAGVDLLRDLAAAAEAAEDWQVEEVPDVPGRELRLRVAFDEPAGLAARVEELHAGLGPEDPAVLRDVALQVDDAGAVRFSAQAGLRLPTTTGAEGDGVTFDVGDLEALLAREGDRAVRYDLRLRLPGPPRAHDADVRDGHALTWHLPVGGLRPIRASSAPPRDRTWLLVAATFLVSAVVALVAVVTLRRRGARLAGSRAERDPRGPAPGR